MLDKMNNYLKLIIVIGAIGMFFANDILAWTVPTSPFLDNTNAPLNTGTGVQIKSGNLIIEGLQNETTPEAYGLIIAKGDVIIGDPTQSVLASTSLSTSTLEIIGGGLSVVDGTQASGKVLMAKDTTGLAEWAYPAYNNKIIMAFNSSSCPSGWSMADGTSGKPDLRGRNVIGSGQGAGLTDRTLGSTGGEESHIFSSAEMYHRHLFQSDSESVNNQGDSESFNQWESQGPDYRNSFNVMDPYYVLIYCVQD